MAQTVAGKSRQALASSLGALKRRQVAEARQYPESCIRNKTTERLSERRLILDLVAVAG
jgi:hypothetical protein